MASMQGLSTAGVGGSSGSLGGGIDNPALELGGSQHNISSTMYNNNGNHNASNSGSKASSYYSSDSTNSNSNSSQSQSLSSSNTDSLDTVIFKGPPSAGSIRDWQQQQQRVESAAAMEQQQIPLDFNHSRSNSRSENNSYRDMSNHFDGQSYQISSAQAQASAAYQPMSHYNNPNNYSMEYRSAQQQQQQQQIHHQHHQPPPTPLTQLPIIQSSHGMRNGVGPSASALAAYHHHQQQQLQQQQQQQLLLGSNPQLPTKSPLLSQKQFSSTDGLILDKAKETNSKQFSAATTKTYNHIKDMISSRFGTNNMMNSGNSKNIPNSVLNNANSLKAYNNNNANNNGLPQHNSSSNNAYHHQNSSVGLDELGLPSLQNSHLQHHHQFQQLMQNGHAHHTPYYATPPSISPYNSNNNNNNPMTDNSSPNTATSSSYLKSPSMNNDRKNVNTSFRKAIQKSTQKSNLVEDSLQMRTIHEVNAANNLQQQQQQTQFMSSNEQLQFHQQQTLIAEQRAQRALEQLLGESTNGQQQQQQQFLRPQNPNSHPQPLSRQAPPPYPEKSTHPLNSILRNSVTKPPVCSPGATSPHYAKPPSILRPHDEPPPLPTTQTPSLQDLRENGDGSSSGDFKANGEQKVSPNSVKSEQLKQMTTDLQNLALSVVVGMNGNGGGGETQSSGSEGDIKGSQRVGSGQSHDSGVGTINSCKASPPPTLAGLNNEPLLLDGLTGQRHKFSNPAGSNSSGNDSEWVDIVEPEIRQVLEMQKRGNGNGKNTQQHPQDSQNTPNTPAMSSSTLHAQKHSNSQQSPKLPKKFDLSTYNKKPNHAAGPGSSQVPTLSPTTTNVTNSKNKSSSKVPQSSTSTNNNNNNHNNLQRSNSGSGQHNSPNNPTSSNSANNNNNANTWNSARAQRLEKPKSSTMGRANKELLTFTQSKSGKLTRSAMNQILHSLNDDNGDITSTTTGGLDLESMLDGPTENTSDDDDDDLSTTIDTTDAHAIRRQLESLETMYTEVLKVLGAKKFGGAMGSRYPPTNDLRTLRRRPYGSMSSLPSSVSSRPFKETKRKFDEKKKVKDIKSINRRFQRLESHVVTLARSVAHLSSEMRTQHLMVQEMESIRNELSQLRNQIMKMPIQTAPPPAPTTAAAMAMGQGQKTLGRQNGGNLVNTTDWTSFRNALPSLTNPCRVRKLTKFFGDEPPLIRIFLKKLGYEKYAIHFEQERIGIMELPYLTEERLQKMGIPMGPRLRILQEAHMCLKPGAHFTVEHPLHNGNTGNLSVYVV